MNDKSKVAIGLHIIAAFMAMGVLLTYFSLQGKKGEKGFIGKAMGSISFPIRNALSMQSKSRTDPLVIANRRASKFIGIVIAILILLGGFLFTRFIPDTQKKEKDKERAWKIVAGANMLVSLMIILPFLIFTRDNDSEKIYLGGILVLSWIINGLCMKNVIPYKYIPPVNSILFIMMLPAIFFSNISIKNAIWRSKNRDPKLAPLYWFFINEPIKVLIIVMLLCNVIFYKWTNKSDKVKNIHPYTKVKEFLPTIWTVALTLAYLSRHFIEEDHKINLRDVLGSNLNAYRYEPSLRFSTGPPSNVQPNF